MIAAPVRIACVFALPIEWSGWRIRHPRFKVVNRKLSIYAGLIGRSHVKVATCGVGAPRIAEVTHALLGEQTHAIVSVGLAAGLREGLRAGDIIVPRDVVSLDGCRTVHGDESLLSLASRCGATIVDRTVCGDRIIGSAAGKREIQQSGSALDLESLPVLAEAAIHRIPAGAIRVIGDAVDEDLPCDFSMMLAADGVDARVMVRSLVSNPRRVARFARFALTQLSALNTLAVFLDRFVVALDQISRA